MKKRGKAIAFVALAAVFVLLFLPFVLSDGAAGELKNKKSHFQRSFFLLVKLDKGVTFEPGVGFKGIDGTPLKINALNQQYSAVIEKSSPQFFSFRYNQRLEKKYGEEGWYKITLKDKKSLSKLYKQYRKEKSFLMVKKVYLKKFYSLRSSG